MIAPPMEFQSERLDLRRLRIEDTDSVFEYASDPEVTRLMDWPMHQDRSESLEFIQRTSQEWDAGDQYSWAITLPTSEELVGVVSCTRISHKVSFGYTLARKHWSHGYATEAAKVIVNWLSSNPAVFRVWAVCDIENTASANVLTKSGLSNEGILRAWEVRPNLPGAPIRDVYVFAKIRDA